MYSDHHYFVVQADKGETLTVYAENIYEAIELTVREIGVHPKLIKCVERDDWFSKEVKKEQKSDLSEAFKKEKGKDTNKEEKAKDEPKKDVKEDDNSNVEQAEFDIE